MKSKEVDDDQSADSHDLDKDESLRCLECAVSFTSKHYLYSHLIHHIQQPYVKLDRVPSSNPPLKITLKNRSGNSFEIVSPVTSPASSEPDGRSHSLDEVPRGELHEETFYAPADDQEDSGIYQAEDLEGDDRFEGFEEAGQESAQSSEHSQGASDDRASVSFSPNLAEVIGGAFLADIDSPIPFEAPAAEEQPQESPKEADTAEGSENTSNNSGSESNSDNTAGVSTLSNGSHANSPPYGSVPGAEPTPPPEPSPTGATEYPKIKIKTTGLFKDPEPRGCTITEITDDNSNGGDPNLSTNSGTPIWTTPSLEDPLKLPDSDNLLSLFNNDRSNKDMGYSSSSDNEFISLDTFNERNRGTMQLYNPNTAVATTSSIESLTGLPMQALAQQVSRLNPSSGQGMHQQNVLINIQQFPTQPQQPYPSQHPQHQPMYPPHYPPHPGQPPMHQPYPYQPPNPMYPHYPPAPGYPPQQPPGCHMPPPPPQHQMGQMQPPQMGQQPGNMGGPGQPPNSMLSSVKRVAWSTMVRLNLRTRLELVEYCEKKRATLTQTAKKFGITVVTVKNILNKASLWVKLYNDAKQGHDKAFTFCENAVLDRELSRWYLELRGRENFKGVTQWSLKKQLKCVAKEHNIRLSVDSNWIKHFVDKHGIVLRKCESVGEVINGPLKKRNVKALSRKKKFYISPTLFSRKPKTKGNLSCPLRENALNEACTAKKCPRVKSLSSQRSLLGKKLLDDVQSTGNHSIKGKVPQSHSKTPHTGSPASRKGSVEKKLPKVQLKTSNVKVKVKRSYSKRALNEEKLLDEVQYTNKPLNVKNSLSKRALIEDKVHLIENASLIKKKLPKLNSLARTFSEKTSKNVKSNSKSALIEENTPNKDTLPNIASPIEENMVQTYSKASKEALIVVDGVHLTEDASLTNKKFHSKASIVKNSSVARTFAEKTSANLRLRSKNGKNLSERDVIEEKLLDEDKFSNKHSKSFNTKSPASKEALIKEKLPKAYSSKPSVSQTLSEKISGSEIHLRSKNVNLKEAITEEQLLDEVQSTKNASSIKKKLSKTRSSIRNPPLTRAYQSEVLLKTRSGKKCSPVKDKVGNLPPESEKNGEMEDKQSQKREDFTEKASSFFEPNTCHLQNVTLESEINSIFDFGAEIKDRLVRAPVLVNKRKTNEIGKSSPNDNTRITRAMSNQLSITGNDPVEPNEICEINYDFSHPTDESFDPKSIKHFPPSRRKSPRMKFNLNSTTDDANKASIDHGKPRRRRKKCQEHLHEVQLLEENLHEETSTALLENGEELDYCDAIEKDNVVEILCNENFSCQPKATQKIAILSDVQLISGSGDVVPEPITATNPNFDVSWSNLFPDLDEAVSADELVNQINEIEFQYDRDAFKNLKIEVLSSGYTDEDENDGADGDDECEDDDVPSSQGQPMPPPNQMPQPPNSMQGGYRPPMPPNGRAPAPRGAQAGAARMPGGPRPPMNTRAPGIRPRAPMMRPRGAAAAQPMRGQMRPRLGAPQNGLRQNMTPIKRNSDLQSNAALQAKRKKVDVLTPSDKDDDDCQVICMQPKNTGLPQIESVHGASESSVENNIMKLSDSITLSVRNPPPKPAAGPQKSDAKAVANVLASRGITVTASGKPKEPPAKQASATPTALSLNGAVSIVAAPKPNAPSKPTASENLPTVDLTDDSPSASNPNKNRPGLPYRCDLCPAQYPNAMGLNKHRQTYHKTTSGMCELGVPLINIKQPGIMQKLSQLGINNYIPLPSAGPEGTYALPIISAKNPGNVAALGATQMLSLGPVRAIPRPGANNNNVIKK